MKIKVGINGMGRIGRMILRAIIENNYKNIEIKHINNRTSSETCSSLLKYDSIHGKFNTDLSFGNNYLMINKKRISFSQEKDLNNKLYNIIKKIYEDKSIFKKIKFNQSQYSDKNVYNNINQILKKITNEKY